MIFFLYGPDDYRRLRRRREIFSELRKKYPTLAIEKFDLASPEGIAGLEGFAKGQSLFSEKKLAVLENIYEAEEKNAAKQLLPLAERKDLALLISEKEKPNKALDFLAKALTILSSELYIK